MGRARTRKQRIYVVDDHPLVRGALVDLIGSEGDLTVVGEAETAGQALREIGTLAPDLAVVDLCLPDGGGLDLIRKLAERKPKIPVVAFSMHDETLYAERALNAGARGYVMKLAGLHEVRLCIRRVLQGKLFVSDRLSTRLFEQVAVSKAPGGSSPLARLSPRERQVFDMIGRGQSTKGIARALGLSIKTIETYRAKLKEKLRLNTGTELHRHAVSWATAR